MQMQVQFPKLIASRSLPSTFVKSFHGSQRGGQQNKDAYTFWVGKVPMFESDIKRTVHWLVKRGQPVNRTSLLKHMQEESNLLTKKMKEQHDPYAW